MAGICILLGFAGCAHVAQGAEVMKPPGAGEKYIIGYVFARNSLLIPDELAVEKLTHVNYAFANIQDGMMVERSGNDGKNFETLNSLRSRNGDLKILVSVSGWTWYGYFSDMALARESRGRFIQSAIDFIQGHQLNGLDIDWEYPALPGYGNIPRREDNKNFTSLIKELWKSFDQLGEKNRKRYLLTIAAGAFEDFLKHKEMGKVQKYLDFVNLMTYDFAGN
jgi:chitinase